ncbi:hypothetical protein FSP39_024864 [Pinctada imbricata]|uniref:DNA 3'-5' helicase n=1 Tax=Pinctada imbricata TaxID=66713 RepID=A0AA88XFF0_PINIB|nr:hypothetical protein FSP39_024864 [Pinctada imbricata]
MATSNMEGAMKEAINKTAQEMYPELNLSEDQIEAIGAVIRGSDTIVNLPVGSGKSLIFHLLPDAVDEAEIIFCHPEALLCCKNGSDTLTSLSGRVGVICIDECHKIEEWGKEFRKSFSDIHMLRSFFPYVPMLCLSGSLTSELMKNLPTLLGLKKPKIISRNPDVRNVFLEVRLKEKGSAQEIYEEIFIKEIMSLKSLKTLYPVTLLFLPLQYMSYAMRYAFKMFPDVKLSDSLFCALFSNQDADVVNTILSDLKKESPQFRLVFTTSVIGMGFDSPSVSRIIHAKPPRSMTSYLQEIGRAGRRGQDASATLYFNKSDIASNLPGIETDIVQYCMSETCLRSNLLKAFCYEKSESSPVGCKCCSICKRSCDCLSCK